MESSNDIIVFFCSSIITAYLPPNGRMPKPPDLLLKFSKSKNFSALHNLLAGSSPPLRRGISSLVSVSATEPCNLAVLLLFVSCRLVLVLLLLDDFDVQVTIFDMDYIYSCMFIVYVYIG